MMQAGGQVLTAYMLAAQGGFPGRNIGVHYRGSPGFHWRVRWDTRGRTNLVPNGGFEVDAGMWSTLNAAALTRTVEEAALGQASGRVETDGAGLTEGIQSDTMDLVLGSFYRASAYILAPEGAELSLRVIQIGGPNIITIAVTGTGTWERVSGEGLMPSSGDERVRFRVFTEGSAQALTFYVDGCQLERGSNLTDYIDTSAGAVTVPRELVLERLDGSGTHWMGSVQLPRLRRFAVEAVGSRHRVFVGGQVVLDVTDEFNREATRHGLYAFEDSSPGINEFSVWRV